jgi:hypothetical protein
LPEPTCTFSSILKAIKKNQGCKKKMQKDWEERKGEKEGYENERS